mmetsp:Transcript_20289/g.51261  ORF Transcript_20289/g.51261 Transcript_20289/m.51261 type:complete len:235 (+) Transcript_20289:1214-1918(+)
MPRSSAAAIFFSASVTATPSPPGSTPCFKRSFTPSPGPETIFDFEELPGAEICTATGFDPLLVVSPPACSFARASLSAILAAQIFPAAPHSLCDFLLFVVFKQAGQVIPRCTSSPGRSSVPPSSFFCPARPTARTLFQKRRVDQFRARHLVLECRERIGGPSLRFPLSVFRFAFARAHGRARHVAIAIVDFCSKAGLLLIVREEIQSERVQVLVVAASCRRRCRLRCSYQSLSR